MCVVWCGEHAEFLSEGTSKARFVVALVDSTGYSLVFLNLKRNCL